MKRFFVIVLLVGAVHIADIRRGALGSRRSQLRHSSPVAPRLLCLSTSYIYRRSSHWHAFSHRPTQVATIARASKQSMNPTADEKGPTAVKLAVAFCRSRFNVVALHSPA